MRFIAQRLCVPFAVGSVRWEGFFVPLVLRMTRGGVGCVRCGSPGERRETHPLSLHASRDLEDGPAPLPRHPERSEGSLRCLADSDQTCGSCRFWFRAVARDSSVASLFQSDAEGDPRRFHVILSGSEGSLAVHRAAAVCAFRRRFCAVGGILRPSGPQNDAGRRGLRALRLAW